MTAATARGCRCWRLAVAGEVDEECVVRVYGHGVHLPEDSIPAQKSWGHPPNVESCTLDRCLEEPCQAARFTFMLPPTVGSFSSATTTRNVAS